MNHANQWRITDDFWDKWDHLYAMFERLDVWTPYRGEGHFPDADMLPIGYVSFGRTTRFTPNEQYTLMSLWTIGRSPLIFGGDMTRLDDFTKELLTNPEMLKVNQQSTNNRQFSRENNLIVWVADIPGSKDKYVAFFNAQGKESSDAIVSEISIDLTQLGFKKKVKVRDLWQHKDLGKFKGSFSQKIKRHGAGLYRIIY